MQRRVSRHTPERLGIATSGSQNSVRIDSTLWWNHRYKLIMKTSKSSIFNMLAIILLWWQPEKMSLKCFSQGSRQWRESVKDEETVKSGIQAESQQLWISSENESCSNLVTTWRLNQSLNLVTIRQLNQSLNLVTTAYPKIIVSGDSLALSWKQDQWSSGAH